MAETPASESLDSLELRASGSDCLIRVRVTPRAANNSVAGVDRGALKLRIQAPPVDGAANDKAREFLAELIGCARGAVQLERGHSGRDKTFRLIGFAPAQALAALARAKR